MDISKMTVKLDTTEAVAAMNELVESVKRVEVALKSLSVTIDEGIGGA